ALRAYAEIDFTGKYARHHTFHGAIDELYANGGSLSGISRHNFRQQGGCHQLGRSNTDYSCLERLALCHLIHDAIQVVENLLDQRVEISAYVRKASAPCTAVHYTQAERLLKIANEAAKRGLRNEHALRSQRKTLGAPHRHKCSQLAQGHVH